MDIDDNKLVEKYLNEDDSAFNELLKKYLNPVFNFIRQFVSDASVAEDLTQETFFKAWKNLKRFNPNKSFKTWIFTIAKNTTYDYFKKKKTIPFRIENSLFFRFHNDQKIH